MLTINAINFIDGLDGLAAGVTAIGATAFFIYAYHLAAVGHTRHRGRADVAVGLPGRRLRRLPAPQLLAGAHIHG